MAEVDLLQGESDDDEVVASRVAVLGDGVHSSVGRIQCEHCQNLPRENVDHDLKLFCCDQQSE